MGKIRGINQSELGVSADFVVCLHSENITKVVIARCESGEAIQKKK